ncbi:wall-associated receptor kinase 2-like [Papaver somniferum]|uniref:wall-associated receptor kinase 2-like n=1 Tax=Papaver somniferum TaxID=3469 RepID=UPI000E6F6BFD|nr:wall-associated receptor kinase 2-like [Papaver somniferum]
MFLRFLLFLLLSRLTSSSTTVLPQVKPGCQANCGDIAITYPFGIGPNENGCSLIGDDLSFYNVTCDTSYHPPKPFLWLGTNLTTGKHHMIELTSIAESELRIRIAPFTVCYQNGTGDVPALDEPLSYMYMLSTPFTLFGLGCNSLAYLYAPKKNLSEVCSTTCETKESITDGSCSGSGCCQIPVPEGIKWLISRTNQTSKTNISFSPCSYSFISETDKYTFKASDLDGASFRTKGSNIPVVLDWAIGNKTCEEAQKDLSTFACQGSSNCHNSDKTPGYICTCNAGFVGNPYLSPGCQTKNSLFFQFRRALHVFL